MNAFIVNESKSYRHRTQTVKRIRIRIQTWYNIYIYSIIVATYHTMMLHSLEKRLMEKLLWINRFWSVKLSLLLVLL